MDQSSRYANLKLREEDLIKSGNFILCAYKMKPKAGTGYLEAAAHFAAESSTGTNVEVSTTDDFTKGVDALGRFRKLRTAVLSREFNARRTWSASALKSALRLAFHQFLQVPAPSQY